MGGVSQVRFGFGVWVFGVGFAFLCAWSKAFRAFPETSPASVFSEKIRARISLTEAYVADSASLKMVAGSAVASTRPSSITTKPLPCAKS